MYYIILLIYYLLVTRYFCESNLTTLKIIDLINATIKKNVIPVRTYSTFMELNVNLSDNVRLHYSTARAPNSRNPPPPEFWKGGFNPPPDFEMIYF